MRLEKKDTKRRIFSFVGEKRVEKAKELFVRFLLVLLAAEFDGDVKNIFRVAIRRLINNSRMILGPAAAAFATNNTFVVGE